MNKIIHFSIGVAGFGLLLLAGRAGAQQSESFTVNYASALSPYVLPNSGTNTYTLALPQFNPALGQLNSVVLTLTSSNDVSVEFYNLYSSAVGYSAASSHIPVAINTSLAGLGTLTSSTTTLGTGSAAPGLTAVAGPLVTAQSTLTLNSSLSAYEGTGSQSVTLSVPAEIGTYSATATGAHASSLFVGGTADSYGNITVQYNFQPSLAPVPEPADYFAVTAAAAVLWLANKRRRAQRA